MRLELALKLKTGKAVVERRTRQTFSRISLARLGEWLDCFFLECFDKNSIIRYRFIVGCKSPRLTDFFRVLDTDGSETRDSICQFTKP